MIFSTTTKNLLFIISAFFFAINLLAADTTNIEELCKEMEESGGHIAPNRLKVIRAILADRAAEKIAAAKSKEGKAQLFSAFEKDFAKKYSIEKETQRVDAYRRLLWRYFNLDLKLAQLNIDQASLQRREIELLQAQQKNADDTEILCEIYLETKSNDEKMRGSIKYVGTKLREINELEQKILQEYGNKK